jgi:hypothetical protein
MKIGRKVLSSAFIIIFSTAFLFAEVLPEEVKGFECTD